MEENYERNKERYIFTKIINSKENGMIKVLTGIRRCGKSYLLDPLYKNYLLSIGVKEDHIIKLELDREKNIFKHLKNIIFLIWDFEMPD